MKLAIAGAGMIVKDFLSMVEELPEIQLQAIVGRKSGQENLMNLQAQYGIQTVYFDLEECLSKTEIDTLYVAVPNHLHYQYAKAGLLAGKHVICEKPFTLKVSELIELRAIALEKELVLVEAITNQYLENYQGIKQALQEVGPLKIIECNYSQYSSRYDAFKSGTILPAFDPAFGGGALMDINIYNIHFVVGLLGMPQKVEYLANVAQGIDTSGVLLLDYGETKVVCIGAKDSTAEIRSTIQGEKGALTVLGATNTLPSFTLQVKGSQPQAYQLNKHSHRMYEEFKYFNQLITTKNQTAVAEHLEHSLQVMEIVELALDKAGIHLG